MHLCMLYIYIINKESHELHQKLNSQMVSNEKEINGLMMSNKKKTEELN